MRRGAGYPILFVAGYDLKTAHPAFPVTPKPDRLKIIARVSSFIRCVFLSPEQDASIRLGKDRVANWEIGPLEFLPMRRAVFAAPNYRQTKEMAFGAEVNAK